MSNNQIGSTTHTEQAILNRTFDPDFEIVAVEALGYDGSALQRLKVNSDGTLAFGFKIPAYDEIDMTYVATGDGEGEVETIIYSLDGTPHTTLTLTYNADCDITNVIKS